MGSRQLASHLSCYTSPVNYSAICQLFIFESTHPLHGLELTTVSYIETLLLCHFPCFIFGSDNAFVSFSHHTQHISFIFLRLATTNKATSTYIYIYIQIAVYCKLVSVRDTVHVMWILGRWADIFLFSLSYVREISHVCQAGFLPTHGQRNIYSVY
jgi:hypothetical protein